jgi:UDP-N-acetylglucosamine 2-epimerase (non-hydrolysing)
MAPVVRELGRHADRAAVSVCVTAQHRDMLDPVLELFGIVPDVDLDLMQEGQTPGEVAARVLAGLEPVLRDRRPDWLLVQGDTTTALAAALAGHYSGVSVAHVEAGLRSHDRANPFPEEMNRALIDRLSDLNFAPTAGARDNLLREGIPADSIHVTGNTGIDSLLWASSDALHSRAQDACRSQGLDELFAAGGQELVLVTMHRRENHGEPLRRLCQALRLLAEQRRTLRILYPVHRNPNVWNVVHELLGNCPGIVLAPPLDYLAFVHLLKNSRLVLTDSGGIQEEAPSFGVPVLVLRETTERQEAVHAGTARLIGTDPECVLGETLRLLDDPASSSRSTVPNPFGDGHAAERIVQTLLGLPVRHLPSRIGPLQPAGR